MKHLGDITKINGAAIPAVDVITGGSPCQDLSVAGQRAGLAGERSGLFMEQIRVIKEMRESARANGRTAESIRPRYMVWENVPGAFSSNGGEDFRAVLEETARIADETVSIPKPNGKWTTAGSICGDGWSIAWRTMDAQFWGVPQRRRRIALVADFAGASAGEILFERESMRGDSSESGAAGEGAASDVGQGVAGTECYGIDAAVMTGGNCTAQGPCYYPDKCATLKSFAPHGECEPTSNGVKCLNPHDSQSGRVYDPSGVWHSLSANEGGGQSRDAVCFQGVSVTSPANGNNPQVGDPCHTLNQDSRNYVVAFSQNQREEVRDLQDVSGCITAGQVAHQQTYIALQQNASGQVFANDVCGAISTNSNASGRNTPMVAGFCQGASPQARSIGWQEEVSPTIKGAPSGTAQTPAIVKTFQSTGCGCAEPYTATSFADYKLGVGTIRANGGDLGGDSETLVTNRKTVRRLTPTECARLQGYPDDWCDIPDTKVNGKTVKATDSAIYKAYGNSIALPQWYFALGGIAKYLPQDATLGSLFDGIGGFPKVWSDLHGGNKDLCVWASEIEPFPIAVTMHHFPEEQERSGA